MGPLHGMAHAKGQDFQWSAQLQSAFDATKEALASAVLLVYPSATATTCCTVDALGVAFGGVLEQFLGGSWKPLSFFSRKLDRVQKSYSAFDCELLAMYSAVKHFAYFVEGQRFQRHLAFIVEYTTDVRHVHGQENTVADALSHVELEGPPVCMAEGPPNLDLLSMVQAQEDDDVQAYHTAVTPWVLSDVPIPGTATTVLCDTSTCTPRPIVLISW